MPEIMNIQSYDERNAVDVESSAGNGVGISPAVAWAAVEGSIVCGTWETTDGAIVGDDPSWPYIRSSHPNSWSWNVDGSL